MRRILLLTLSWALLVAAPLMAQAPAGASGPAPPPVTGNVGFGLALTGGNKHTTTFNAGYEFKYDPKRKHVLTSSGLFLYGRTDGEQTAEQYGLNFRDEYTVSGRAFVYGDFRYLHDRFKGVAYLLAPTVGGGYKLVDLPATKLETSAGVGAAWEKDYGADLQTTGAVTFGEKLSQKLGAAATFGQRVSALWKTTDFGDAFYLFGLNLSAQIVGDLGLKLEFVDLYKTKPPEGILKKNDVTFVTAVVYKF